ncbi:MoaD/ThiS family protein [archaeon]|nr:MoaD/ThiS family protein [archaeon]MBL7056682.1 MoaD/ThiS family protein [Candidatus Woesearchaeota archaeon]
MMEKKFSGKIIVLLKSLDINPTSVLVVKNGSLVTEEDSVNDDDSIKILNVISGG